MRRKIGLSRLTLAHDKRISLFAQPVELGGAPRREAILALEAERHAEIHQLNNRQELAGILAHLAEQVEETLATAHLLMKARDKRARGPGPRASPGRVQHHVVQAGAERIMRRAQQLDWQPKLPHALLEAAHRADRALKQIARVGLV